jgi:hypothetical protein
MILEAQVVISVDAKEPLDDIRIAYKIEDGMSNFLEATTEVGVKKEIGLPTNPKQLFEYEGRMLNIALRGLIQG